MTVLRQYCLSCRGPPLPKYLLAEKYTTGPPYAKASRLYCDFIAFRNQAFPLLNDDYDDEVDTPYALLIEPRLT